MAVRKGETRIASAGKSVARISRSSCLVVLFSHQIEDNSANRKLFFFSLKYVQHYDHEFFLIVASSMSKTKMYHQIIPCLRRSFSFFFFFWPFKTEFLAILELAL